MRNIVIDRQYRFFQEDAGGTLSAGSLKQCGKLVTVKEVAECFNCYTVRCADGSEFIAYDNELHEVCLPLVAREDIAEEDKVLALCSDRFVQQGKNYVVRSVNKDGTINLSEWKYDLGTVLPGSYDPDNFRRQIT